jgi:zinc transporter ZupT
MVDAYFLIVLGAAFLTAAATDLGADVPSYLVMEIFLGLLPVGFGIAAGAMIWMTFVDLIPDTAKDATPSAVGTAAALSLAGLLALQYSLL